MVQIGFWGFREPRLGLLMGCKHDPGSSRVL